MKPFRDRIDAGRQLAARLEMYAHDANAIVLALPRGGVPVGAEIAKHLHMPLDVMVVRKLGAPDQPELAMGAIASGGAVIMNPEVEAYFANQTELVTKIKRDEEKELLRRECIYRGNRPPLALHNKVVIVVDDGAATGATVRVAVQAVKLLGARRVVVALPVCSREAKHLIAAEADEVICLKVPTDFYSVGQWYECFNQTSDEEVQMLLAS